jgi:hypothetical protein
MTQPTDSTVPVSARAARVTRSPIPKTISSISALRSTDTSAFVWRLVKFNRIAVRILDLNLFAARADLDLIPEHDTSTLQRLNIRCEIFDVQDDSVPAARLLTPAIRQWPRS